MLDVGVKRLLALSTSLNVPLLETQLLQCGMATYV